MRSQWIVVASVTVANGGDNLGVYIPLFSRELAWVPVYAAVFAVMTAFWCAAGYWLVHHPILGARIRTYGHVALPFVLIGLGLYILADARALIQ
jgi:cadmium resistance protein CadD (predicted permease)